MYDELLNYKSNNKNEEIQKIQRDELNGSQIKVDVDFCLNKTASLLYYTMSEVQQEDDYIDGDYYEFR